MAVTKVLAKDWQFEIDIDPIASTPTGTAVWTAIGGLNNFSFSPSKTDADITDFDDNEDAHIPVRRGLEVTLEGYREEDASNGDRDAGQEAVEEYATMVGSSALANFKLTSPGGTTYEFSASVTMGSPGGGNDDPTSWSVTLLRSGSTTVT